LAKGLQTIEKFNRQRSPKFQYPDSSGRSGVRHFIFQFFMVAL